MSTKLLVSLLVGVVVVVGAVFLFKGDSSNTMMNGSENNGSEQSNGNSTKATSLKALLSSGSSQQCTFSHNVTEGSAAVESSGTVYVGGGKMRGDFVSKTSGQTVMSHMIVDGETSYVWSDAIAQGFKMNFSEMSANTNASSENKVDVNQQLDYSCNGWNVDAGVFTLPGNVKFSSLGEMMGGSAGAGANGSAGGSMMTSQCSACDQASDANSKAQCRAALGC